MEYLNSMTRDEFINIQTNIFRKLLAEHKADIEKELSATKQLVSTGELSEKLKISKQTIHNWCEKGLIKKEKMGGKVFYDLKKIITDIEFKPMRFGNRNYNI